jgi:hypothetical protein
MHRELALPEELFSLTTSNNACWSPKEYSSMRRAVAISKHTFGFPMRNGPDNELKLTDPPSSNDNQLKQQT